MIDATGGTGDGTDGGDAFAAIRQACVQLRFPGRAAPPDDRLPRDLGPAPSPVTVELDPHTVHRLLLAVGLRPAGLRQLRTRLAGGGLLIDWLLANDAMLPHVIRDSHRVHLPP